MSIILAIIIFYVLFVLAFWACIGLIFFLLGIWSANLFVLGKTIEVCGLIFKNKKISKFGYSLQQKSSDFSDYVLELLQAIFDY